MQKPHFTQEQLVQVAKLTEADLLQIGECRGAQNQVGYALDGLSIYGLAEPFQLGGPLEEPMATSSLSCQDEAGNYIYSKKCGGLVP
jgi:hypothetical protein